MKMSQHVQFTKLTTHSPDRKLWFLQPGLRLRPPPRSPQRQSLVPRSLRLLRVEQTP